MTSPKTWCCRGATDTWERHTCNHPQTSARHAQLQTTTQGKRKHVRPGFSTICCHSGNIYSPTVNLPNFIVKEQQQGCFINSTKHHCAQIDWDSNITDQEWIQIRSCNWKKKKLWIFKKGEIKAQNNKLVTNKKNLHDPCPHMLLETF
jgi:hypothetical protein